MVPLLQGRAHYCFRHIAILTLITECGFVSVAASFCSGRSLTY
jgi:hypothetical protein